MLNLRRATVCGAIATLLLSVVACAHAPGEAEGTTESRLSTIGDWSLLGDGQCLAAMQSFYAARFGVRLPTARASPTGGCAGEGACHLWYDDIPDAALWARIPNDGTSSPVTYDLVVFAETATNPYGHIASVDHVEDGTIYVMDSNFNLDERRSTTPHAVRAPLGWYHLRSLGGSESGDPTGGETCGDRAARLGWPSALCEQASSSAASSRSACNGAGNASSDCTRCCNAELTGPAHTDESCGVYASRVGFASARCESETNDACNGSGPSTGDGCLHCCDAP